MVGRELVDSSSQQHVITTRNYVGMLCITLVLQGVITMCVMRSPVHLNTYTYMTHDVTTYLEMSTSRVGH